MPSTVSSDLNPLFHCTRTNCFVKMKRVFPYHKIFGLWTLDFGLSYWHARPFDRLRTSRIPFATLRAGSLLLRGPFDEVPLPCPGESLKPFLLNGSFFHRNWAFQINGSGTTVLSQSVGWVRGDPDIKPASLRDEIDPPPIQLQSSQHGSQTYRGQLQYAPFPSGAYYNWHARQDSNLRPAASKADALSS